MRQWGSSASFMLQIHPLEFCLEKYGYRLVSLGTPESKSVSPSGGRRLGGFPTVLFIHPSWLGSLRAEVLPAHGLWKYLKSRGLGQACRGFPVVWASSWPMMSPCSLRPTGL